MKKNFKRLLFIILIITTIVPLTSCMDAEEVDELGIALATGVDMEDGKILLTIEIIKPRPVNKGDVSSSKDLVTYVQTSGETIAEALIDANLEFQGRITLSHNMIYILGEDFAKSGIALLLDFLQRDNKQRELAYLVIAKGGKAYEVMGISSDDIPPGEYLLELIENDEYTSKMRSLKIFEFFRYVYKKDNEVVLGVVKLVQKNVIDKVEEMTSKTKQMLNIEGGAVFKLDKLIGYFSGEEMVGFKFIIDDVDSTFVTINTPTPNEEDNKNEKTVIQIIKSNTKKDIEIIDDKMNLIIKVRAKATIREQIGNADITDYQIFKDIEKLASKEIEKHIIQTMEKSQKEFKQDNFSIGVLLRGKYPEIWKKVENNWAEVFSTIDYTLDVKTEILRTGLVNRPGKREGAK